MPAEAPKDFIGQILTKALGNRSPSDFVPMIVPPEIKSPAELMASEPKKDSVPGVIEKFIPLNAPKAVGDIGEDFYDFARSLTPQNIAGKGSIDLPEPKRPDELILKPHSYSAKEFRLNSPPGLPAFPLPLPPGLKPPHELFPPPPGFGK